MSRLRTLLVTALSVSALLASVPAEAKQKHCPPGLAKKNPPCVPPGQVGKSWNRGDRIRGDYAWIPREDWRRWNLRDYRDGSTYLRVDNHILRVVRDTLVVIEAVRIIDDALN
ncbi:excinuclease ABC subunit A [Tabrizicola piscis]|uniref:Excinuclease ABC subunit A n=1 Tax=Tabrizicola piscis TaxID=2494374 RepID=A0A3S8UBF1_9RHOB|nr:excinuclease ABC subunit A [Tabrizicola piscis]AZL60889.1 excinuclease ABC subunit A [Tabrizicola piscis]